MNFIPLISPSDTRMIGYPKREIVIFSKDCFEDKELLFKLAAKHNPGIYDALAGKKL